MLRTVFATFVLAVLATGCKSQCRQLSESLCTCTLNSVEKDSCLRTASAAESANPPSREDEDNCRALLNQCDCRLIDTTAGKIKCGLARPGPVATNDSPDAG